MTYSPLDSEIQNAGKLRRPTGLDGWPTHTDDEVGVTVVLPLADDLVGKLLGVRQRLDRLRGVLHDAGQLQPGPLLTFNRPQDHCVYSR
jgi:hypothetical protein